LDHAYQEESDDNGRLFFKIISGYLKKHNKKIIVFIENFGDILRKFKEHEEKAFREILMESSQIRIVGSSSKSLEASYDYKKAFYQFFKFVTLKGLNKKDTEQFLLKLGEFSGPEEHEKIKKILVSERARVESLRRLTNGIPRTMVLLFEIFLEGTLDSAYAYLEKMLDGVTPLYQHRMDDLPDSQQPIVNAMALNWDGLTAKELAKKTRLSTKLLSAQLKKMENNWIVEKTRQKNSKNQMYILKERFFNIWYLMRYGRRRDKRRVIWLTQFFELWCSSEELIFRNQKFIHALKNGDFIPEGAFIFASAMAQVKNLSPEYKEELIQETEQSFIKCGRESLAKEFVKLHPYTSEKIDVTKLIETEQYEELEKHFLAGSKKGDHKALYNLALLYHDYLQKYEEAEKYYLLAIENGHVNALNNLALLYEEHFQKYEEAEKYYLLAIENGHVNALNNLAGLYYEYFQKYEEAEKYSLLAIEKGCVTTLNNLAVLYLEKNWKNKKKSSLKLVKESYEKSNTILHSFTLAVVLLWNNEIEQALITSQRFFIGC